MVDMKEMDAYTASSTPIPQLDMQLKARALHQEYGDLLDTMALSYEPDPHTVSCTPVPEKKQKKEEGKRDGEEQVIS